MITVLFRFWSHCKLFLPRFGSSHAKGRLQNARASVQSAELFGRQRTHLLQLFKIRSVPPAVGGANARGRILARTSHHLPAAAPYVAPWTASEPPIRSSTLRPSWRRPKPTEGRDIQYPPLRGAGRIGVSSLPGHYRPLGGIEGGEHRRHLRAVSGEKTGLTRISHHPPAAAPYVAPWTA